MRRRQAIARRADLALALTLALALGATACTGVKGPRGRLGTQALQLSQAAVPLAAGIVGRVLGPAAGVVGNHAGSLVANNAASLIANNAAGILTNNAAGIITNNAAGIITNNAAGYLLSAAATPDPGQRVVGAFVEVLDETGRVVSKAPVPTDAEGAFRFAPEDLAPGGELRVVRATATLDGHRATFYSVLAADAVGRREVTLNAANTLVGKRMLYRLRVRVLRADDFTGGSTDDLGEAIAPYLSDQAVSLALLGEPEAASQAFDLVVGALPALATELRAVVQAEGGAELLDPPTTPPAPDAGPTPPTRGAAPTEDDMPTATGTPPALVAPADPVAPGGATGGGGSVDAPNPSAATIAFSTAGHYTLVRAAGDDAGGNAAGTSPTTAALGGVAGVAVAADGTLYLADAVNHQVLRIPPGAGATRLAGAADGTAGLFDHVVATASKLDTPCGLVLDQAAGMVLVADAGNGLVRALRPGARIDAFAGGGTTTASPTTALALRLDEPVALAADGAGRTYVADRAGGRVWRLDPDRAATLVAAVAGARALAIDPGRDLLWIGTGTGEVRVVSAASTAPALAATPITPGTGGAAVNGLACDQRGGLYALLEAAGGAGAQVWFVPYDAAGALRAGRTPERIAGLGTAGADAAAYAAPLAPLADAKQGRLITRFPGALAIDLNAAASAGTLAGQLYVGTSYAAELTRGQVVRLDPVE